MQLIVFDLDFTLWNAGGTWCDHTFPPYRKKDSRIIDSIGNIIFLYPDTKRVLEHLNKNKIEMALASRTHEPLWAKELLTLFEIDHYFKFKEIYPGSKIEHFNQLNHNSGKNFSDMIFFDDEMRNIDEVSRLGVTSVLVDKGITWDIVIPYVDNN